MEANNKKYNIVKAESRGHAEHSWLDTYHSFSFANYHDPQRVHFGALRVLNDDKIAGGEGFGKHPHDNMEIVTIPIKGDLRHGDSMGNTTVIKEGDIQVMSAGTGVFHSEVNNNSDKSVELLQIWIIPNKQSVDPRYGQITLDIEKMKNRFLQVLSPNREDDGVWIYQDAWFHMGDLDKNFNGKYLLKKSGNGVYVFLIEGVITVDGHKLNKRDAISVKETNDIEIVAEQPSKVLIIEVPLKLYTK